jgi:hypothetical protein
MKSVNTQTADRRPQTVKTYTALDLYKQLRNFVSHRERTVENPNYGDPRRKSSQLKSITAIRTRIAILPATLGTQAMINHFYILRKDIRNLLYSEDSRFAQKRGEILDILSFANENHTCNGQ